MIAGRTIGFQKKNQPIKIQIIALQNNHINNGITNKIELSTDLYNFFKHIQIPRYFDLKLKLMVE